MPHEKNYLPQIGNIDSELLINSIPPEWNSGSEVTEQCSSASAITGIVKAGSIDVFRVFESNKHASLT